MGTTAKRLLFAVLLLAMASAPYALNYMYVSDEEVTQFGDRIKWWHGDSLWGPIRTNSQFAIMQDPIFYDYVIQSAEDFWRGSGYNPGFPNTEWIFRGATHIDWPANAHWHREQAISRGHYLDEGDTMRARVWLHGDWLRVWFAGFDQSFDSVFYNDYPIGDSAIYWIEAPITVSGTLSSTLILGTNSTAGLENNLLYASSDSVTGEVTPGHAEKFALIAQGDLKVLNTVANGRENSGGRGMQQTDLDSTSILLNGLYYSIGGSITFAEQNDVDSGYVCQCAPDDRGTIYLWGGLGQQQRGYMHRSSRNSTGYLKQYRYDPDLKFWNTGLFPNVLENVIDPPLIEFDTLTVGENISASTFFVNEFVPLRLTEISATPPFLVEHDEQDEAWTHELPVMFAPEVPGIFDGTLTFRSDYYNRTFTVPLHGVAEELGANEHPSTLPDRLTLGVYPNPFNNMATLTFTLPEAGNVKLVLFDVLGREVRTLTNSAYRAGEHKLSVNGSGLESGLYFARLESGHATRTEKLLLVK